MWVWKDKVYYYFKLFKNGLTIIEIFENYRKNKMKCGRTVFFINRKSNYHKEAREKEFSKSTDL